MVVHLTQLAGTLGVQARWALVWYFVAKFAAELVWAGVALIAVLRVTKLLGGIGYGQALLSATCKASGLNYPNSDTVARAIRLIVDGWPSRGK